MKRLVFLTLFVLSFSFAGIRCGSSNVMEKKNINSIEEKADSDVDKNTDKMLEE